MGAWGVKVLENDYANDDLSRFLVADPVRNFASQLLQRYHDEFALLLGVAIVDASINGVDFDLLGSWGDHPDLGKEFFANLSADPLTDLLSEAQHAIAILIHNGASDWDDPQERMDLFYTYRDRLS